MTVTVLIVVAVTLVTTRPDTRGTPTALPSPSEQPSRSRGPVGDTTAATTVKPPASAGSSTPAETAAEPVFRERTIRLRGLTDGSCSADIDLPHADLDTATVYPEFGNSSGVDLTYGSICFGDAGLFIPSSTLFGSAPAGTAERDTCAEAARSGSENPYPAAQLTPGTMFCAITDSSNVALLTVTSAEGPADSRNLPTVTFSLTLWES